MIRDKEKSRKRVKLTQIEVAYIELELLKGKTITSIREKTGFSHKSISDIRNRLVEEGRIQNAKKETAGLVMTVAMQEKWDKWTRVIRDNASWTKDVRVGRKLNVN